MKSNLFATLLALLLFASAAPAQLFEQTLPHGLNNLEGNGVNADPFMTGGSQRWQWVFDSSMFDVQSPIIIRDISVRTNLGAASGAFDFPSMSVTMASATANYDALSTSNMNSNLGPNSFMWRPALPFQGTGTTASPCGTGSWVKILQGGFQVFDPRLGQDLVIEVQVCGSNTNFMSALDAQSGTMAHRYGDVTSCSGSVASISDDLVPVLLIEYAASPEWEINDANASLKLNGQDNNRVTQLKVEACANMVNALAINSTLSTGWELAISFFPGVSASGGGFRSSSGQIINIDLGHDIIFFNGLTFSPFPGSINFLLNFPAPMTFTTQMLILNPASPDGSSLSALGELEVGASFAPPASPIAGPTMDDESMMVNVGCFPFFGKRYSEMFVSSNGRLTFSTGDPTAAPVSGTSPVCTQPPQVGYWADLDPSAGGTISISQSGSQTLRVDYTNVPYAGFPAGPTNTFYIELDGLTGAISIGGITGIATHPGGGSPQAFLGISPGQGPVQDSGSAAFTPGGPFFPTSPTSSRYEMGTPGSLSSGVNLIRFTPLLSSANAGNYRWIVQ